MTSIHPYLAWSNKGINFWGSVGYGQGQLEISDTRMLSLSAGVKGPLSQVREMSIKSDVSLIRTNIKGAMKETLNNQQLRLILEFERERALSSGGVLKPVLELDARYDDGDGDSGLGVVLGVGLRYANSTGLTVEGKLHGLIGRKNYKEWGVQGTIRQQTNADRHGLSFSLNPSYGNTASSTDQVWQGVPKGNSNSPDNSARLNVSMGYGFAPNGGLLTPYSEVTFGDQSRNYRLGIRWQRDSFNMHLVGERRESNGVGNNRILLESQIYF